MTTTVKAIIDIAMTMKPNEQQALLKLIANERDKQRQEPVGVEFLRSEYQQLLNQQLH